jgi:hypothetical protein
MRTLCLAAILSGACWPIAGVSSAKVPHVVLTCLCPDGHQPVRCVAAAKVTTPKAINRQCRKICLASA